MNSLLTLERVILESIAKGCLFEGAISSDTGLHFSLVKSICNKLIKKGLVCRGAEGYSVLYNEFTWKNINSRKYIKNEVEEVASEIVKSYFESNGVLKLQKIYLSSSDEKILNSLLKNVEIFVENLKKEHLRNKNKYLTKDRKVLMWGFCDYGQILENLQKVG